MTRFCWRLAVVLLLVCFVSASAAAQQIAADKRSAILRVIVASKMQPKTVELFERQVQQETNA